MPEPSAGGRGNAPWVIVSPGFHRGGGMERANLAVAEYLADRGTEVHLVGHTIDQGLANHPRVRPHLVERPMASFLLAEGMLNRRGRSVARRVRAERPDARVMVNGGNCSWDDINWVHCVHHAWNSTSFEAPFWFRAKDRILRLRARRDERRAIPIARIVISNSMSTTRHMVELLKVAPARIRTVYLGAERGLTTASPEERAAARSWLSVDEGVPVVAFVGALGYDTNKGFDTVLEAWRELTRTHGWEGVLVAAGGGRGLRKWRERVVRLDLGQVVRFLGHTTRVADLLAAADLLVSPVRYEAYGLNVHEAICRGVPAIVSRSSGIAERYPAVLDPLLLDDPENVAELVAAMLRWRNDPDGWRGRAEPFGEELRRRDWSAMASELVAVAEAQGLR